jgi:hypothetical protein
MTLSIYRMEQKIIRLLKATLANGKGMIAIIGETYTGKTYTVNKILQKLKLRTIPYDFENVPKGVKGSKGEHNPLVKKFQKRKGNKIQDFYTPSKNAINCTIDRTKGEILFCDALETYSSSVLTFLKNVCEIVPVIVTCDKSVVIPNTKLIERVWWNGKKRTPEGWEGDPILQTPRDLFASLTQRRTKTDIAVRNFGSDSFLLTQYYHDEFPTYKKADLDTIVASTNALSTLDMFRVHEWNSNGILSTARANEELFVRTIRSIHKNPCLNPKGWFPKTLAKQGKITRNALEMCSIETQIPNVHDTIHAFDFKVGKSFAYKTEAKILLPKCDEPTLEAYSRAIELVGKKSFTKTEIKKLLK